MKHWMTAPEEFNWHLPKGMRDVRFHFYDVWDRDLRLAENKADMDKYVHAAYPDARRSERQKKQ